MDPSSNELHIQFVSNVNGSSASDVFLATLPAPLTVALTAVAIPLVPAFLLPSSSSRYASLHYSSRIWIHWLVEVVTVICPILLSLTFSAGSTSMIVVSLLLTIIGLMLAAPSWWRTHITSMDYLLHLKVPDSKPPFLTNYRAGLNLVTAICILAVDFPIFPRRFAKTEMYGFSLMDVGVGSFVMVNGLAGSSSYHSRKAGRILFKTLPIFLLGLLRLAAVKLSGYHEHVTEYGVHWNFFFTLCVVKAVPALIALTPASSLRPAAISAGLLVLYELCLKCGLESWILSDSPRNGFVSANREGLFSLLGYLALYYAALELGKFVNKPRAAFKDWLRLLGIFAVIALLGWMGLQVSTAVFGRPSRRLTNASFCFWMVSYNSAMMACYLLVDLLLVGLDARRDSPEEAESHLPVFREPYLMRFINYNGLAFFLAANLLTGLVNKTLDTIRTAPAASALILLAYCNILSFSTAILYLWRIRFQ